MNYSTIAFSDASKALQERYGSRASYAHMEPARETDGLTDAEIEFIGEQDNFYLGSSGPSGFPYIQFRGGPKGFLKVIDTQTLGFIDFGGNKQYITTGNLATNNKVALFLLDQAAKARLKIFAEAEVLEINSNQELFALLALEDYKYRPERIILLHIKGYDWNCPQHITERYTLAQIQEQFAAQHEYIGKLRSEIESLKAKLSEKKQGR